MTFPKRASPFLFVLALALLAGCRAAPQPAPADLPWQSADLRALAAPNIPDPAHDLIAAYARLTASDLELRVDLLGSPDPFDYDLYVAYQGGTQAQAEHEAHFPLDAQPGLAWDLVEAFPARGLPRAFGADGAPAAVRPRIARLNVQDAAVVRLSLAELGRVCPGDPRQAVFQIFLTRPGERTVVDSIGPLHVDGPAPAASARVLLAFWNTLPAATPAQALRRWDGAHTGPYGQRHGLRVLLQAAQRTRTPVTLLDLKQPDSLAALEALGGLPLVQDMVKDGLVLLPDAADGSAGAEGVSLGYSRQAGQRFGFASSPFLYGAIPASRLDAASQQAGGIQSAFASLDGADGLRQWNGLRLIPLPGALDQPSGAEGAAGDSHAGAEAALSLPVRRALLDAALNQRPGGLVSLGGDLPGSPWGDSLIAEPAMAYLAGHPWLKVVSGADLLEMPAPPGAPNCPDLRCAAADLPPSAAQNLATIRAAIQGAAGASVNASSLFRDLAWQAYLRLSQPAGAEALQSDRLNSLRAGQLGQVIGPLLAAADWNNSPAESASCDRDLNWDGAPECTLADANTFLVLDPRGGRLVYAAARVSGRPVQLITAQAQYALGLGDPLELRPERGPAGDPQGIPGGFAPPLAPYNADDWLPYQVETRPGKVTLTHPLSGLRKTYRLTASGFEVSLVSPPGSPNPAETALPLALVDAAVSGGYSRYQAAGSAAADTVTWRLDQGPRVQAHAQNAALASRAFSESRDLLRKPEDPNLGYPAGHFIPFPLAVISIRPAASYTIELSVR